LNYEYNFATFASDNQRQRGLDPILWVPNTGAGYIADIGTDDNYGPQISASQLRNAEVITSMGMLERLRTRWMDNRSAALNAQHEASGRAGFIAALSKTFRLTSQSLVLGLGAYLAIQREISNDTLIFPARADFVISIALDLVHDDAIQLLIEFVELWINTHDMLSNVFDFLAGIHLRFHGFQQDVTEKTVANHHFHRVFKKIVSLNIAAEVEF
jgi:hypothetical protein